MGYNPPRDPRKAHKKQGEEQHTEEEDRAFFEKRERQLTIAFTKANDALKSNDRPTAQWSALRRDLRGVLRKLSRMDARVEVELRANYEAAAARKELRKPKQGDDMFRLALGNPEFWLNGRG